MTRDKTYGLRCMQALPPTFVQCCQPPAAITFYHQSILCSSGYKLMLDICHPRTCFTATRTGQKSCKAANTRGVYAVRATSRHVMSHVTSTVETAACAPWSRQQQQLLTSWSASLPIIAPSAASWHCHLADTIWQARAATPGMVGAAAQTACAHARAHTA